MAELKQDRQSFLFSATSGFYGILAARGDLACSEVEEYGNMEDIGFRVSELPTQQGIYVWEGSIQVETGGWCGSEPVEPDTDYIGKWRLAVVSDLEEFGWFGEGPLEFPPLRGG